MNLLRKNKIKYLKLLIFPIIALTLVLISAPAQATELQTAPKLYAGKMMDSYASTASSSFYWNADYKNKLQSQINARQSNAKKSSLAERLAAISLGILMEFTTNNTYNELIVQ